MGLVKVYLNDAEQKEVEENAQREGLSVSTYVKQKLMLTSATTFSTALANTIRLAKALPSSDFFVPDLYSKADWRNLTSVINAGQLGRRFYEAVDRREVVGVTFKEIKNRKALYTKN